MRGEQRGSERKGRGSRLAGEVAVVVREGFGRRSRSWDESVYPEGR